MRPIHIAVQASIGLFVCVVSAVPATAQGVGGIGGTIVDTSGAVLPGVTVALSSAQATIGGSQQTVTDDRGEYQFLRLVPGTYRVSAELQGFRRAEQANVIVNSDVTARVDLRLEVGAVEEGVTVTGQ